MYPEIHRIESPFDKRCRFPGCDKKPAFYKAKGGGSRFFYRYCSEYHFRKHLELIRAEAPARIAAYEQKKKEKENV
jgi:hypothetical protein